MADVKQIMVVDDHFEMLELLRSMLKLSGHDYEVFAVPSAEEAMLELLRVPFDLLITDVRLPGMSGFDFVRRVRRRQPDLPVIMITAYSSAQGKKEAEELGVYRYFAKPLDTDNVLTAVHTALYGESVAPPEAPPPEAAGYALPDTVQRRLQSLQMDTGATGLLLSTVQGQVLLELGDNSRLDVPRIIATVAENVANSLMLAELLGEVTPFTIQYHTGKATELYNANVGRNYFVTLIFGLESRRGRIGTIWVFAQRAIRDLLHLLPTPPEADDARLNGEKKEALTPAAAESAVADLFAALTTAPQTPEADLASFWEEAVKQTPEATSLGGTLTLAEAAALVNGLPLETEPAVSKPAVSEPAANEPQTPEAADMNGLLAALNLSEAETAVNLDEFWREALNDSDTGDDKRGLSFDEAMRQGLINLGKNEPRD